MHSLTAWINESEENKEYFNNSLKDWARKTDRAQAHYYNKEQAYARFSKRVKTLQVLTESTANGPVIPVTSHRQRNNRKLYYKLTSAAAILIILLALGFYLRQYIPGQSKQDRSAQSGLIEVKVPDGSRQKLLLPDKSVVWINAGSSFKYPASFSGKTREVFLNGEGYFQVAKDASHPFIVNTIKGSITVTGTTFDVYAYENKPRFETALLEGHVHVQMPDGQVVYLHPSQKAELKNSSLTVSAIENPDEYRWKEGLICFDNKPITEVLEKLQTAFGHKIIIRHLKEPQLLLTGKFRISDGLDYALTVLKDSYGLAFKKESKDTSYIILN